MRESRRVFLGLAFGTVATVAAGAPRQVSVPSDPTQTPPMPPVPSLPRHNREELTVNQVTIKKDINRMSQLVGELQKGLDDNDTKQVLSLDVIHKTEEIEKLAKQIRELVRG